MPAAIRGSMPQITGGTWTCRAERGNPSAATLEPSWVMLGTWQQLSHGPDVQRSGVRLRSETGGELDLQREELGHRYRATCGGGQVVMGFLGPEDRIDGNTMRQRQVADFLTPGRPSQRPVELGG